MRKLLIIVIILTACMYSSAQTGPGGVGRNDGTSSLELWLRGDAGVTTNASNVVTTWLDQSGNGNTSTIFGNPTQTATINGYSVISLDGNDYFRSVVAANTGTRASVYVAASITGFAGPSSGYNGILSGSRNSVQDYSTSQSVVFLLRWRTNNSLTTSRGPRRLSFGGVTSTRIRIMNSEYNGSRGRLRNNGSSSRTFNSSGNFNFNEISIGARMISFTRATIGSYGEVIYFNTSLNTAQKIIIENYLQAKYNGTLAASVDVYDEDNMANGNYDHDVAGIGRVNATNLHSDSQGTGIVRILNPTGLGNNEFLMWGHDNGTLSFINASDMPANVGSRFARVWRVSEANTSGTAVDVGNIDMRFDLTGVTSFTTNSLSLLVDTDNDGLFADETPISGATSLGGNVYQFAGVSAIANNLRFTLANCNSERIITQAVCDSLRSPSSRYLWTSTGTYRDTLTNTLGCDSIMIFNLTVNYSSTITLSQDTVAICQGDDSAVFSFTGTTNNPDRYSIDFNSAAETAGFTDVTDATLSDSSITVTVPTGAATATYDANLTVKNATENCPSSQYGIHIVVRPSPNSGNIQPD